MSYEEDETTFKNDNSFRSGVIRTTTRKKDVQDTLLLNKTGLFVETGENEAFSLDESENEDQTSGSSRDSLVILEEVFTPDYNVTEEEVVEYANRLGIDAEQSPDLFFLARKALLAPLPRTWTPVKDKENGVYYFNHVTGESSWTHPVDASLRQFLKQSKRREKDIADTDSCVDDIKTEEEFSFYPIKEKETHSTAEERNTIPSDADSSPLNSLKVSKKETSKSASSEEENMDNKEYLNPFKSLPPVEKKLPPIGDQTTSPTGSKSGGLNSIQSTRSLQNSSALMSPIKSNYRNLSPSRSPFQDNLSSRPDSGLGQVPSQLRQSASRSPLKPIIKTPGGTNRLSNNPNPQDKNLRFKFKVDNIMYLSSDEEEEKDEEEEGESKYQASLKNERSKHMADAISIPADLKARNQKYLDSPVSTLNDSKNNLAKSMDELEIISKSSETKLLQPSKLSSNSSPNHKNKIENLIVSPPQKPAPKPQELQTSSLKTNQVVDSNKKAVKPRPSTANVASANNKTTVATSATTTATKTTPVAITANKTISTTSTVTKSVSVAPAVAKTTSAAQTASKTASSISAGTKAKPVTSMATKTTSAIQTANKTPAVSQTATKTTSATPAAAKTMAATTIKATSATPATTKNAAAVKKVTTTTTTPAVSAATVTSATATTRTTTATTSTDTAFTSSIPSHLTTTTINTTVDLNVNSNERGVDAKINTDTFSTSKREGTNSINPTAPTTLPISNSVNTTEGFKGNIQSTRTPIGQQIDATNTTRPIENQLELEMGSRFKKTTNPMERVVAKFNNKNNDDDLQTQTRNDDSVGSRELFRGIHDDQTDEESRGTQTSPTAKRISCLNCRHYRIVNAAEDSHTQFSPYFESPSYHALKEDFLLEEEQEIMRDLKEVRAIQRKSELALREASLSLDRGMKELLCEHQNRLREKHAASINLMKRDLELSLEKIQRETKNLEEKKNAEQLSRITHLQNVHKIELEMMQTSHRNFLDNLKQENQREISEIRRELEGLVSNKKINPNSRSMEDQLNTNQTIYQDDAPSRISRSENLANRENSEFRKLQNETQPSKKTVSLRESKQKHSNNSFNHSECVGHRCRYGSKYNEIKKRYSTLIRQIRHEKSRGRNSSANINSSSSSSEESPSLVLNQRGGPSIDISSTDPSSPQNVSSTDTTEFSVDLNPPKMDKASDFLSHEQHYLDEISQTNLSSMQSQLTSLAKDSLMKEGQRILSQTLNFLNSNKVSDSEEEIQFIDKFDLDELNKTKDSYNFEISSNESEVQDEWENYPLSPFKDPPTFNYSLEISSPKISKLDLILENMATKTEHHTPKRLTWQEPLTDGTGDGGLFLEDLERRSSSEILYKPSEDIRALNKHLREKWKSYFGELSVPLSGKSGWPMKYAPPPILPVNLDGTKDRVQFSSSPRNDISTADAIKQRIENIRLWLNESNDTSNDFLDLK